MDELEPAYQQVIHADRLQGLEALLANVLGEDFNARRRRWLAEAVGGAEALRELDVEPLPDEDFDWQDIADDIRPVVGQFLEACDRCADELLDVEHRTAMRRSPRRVAIADPTIFRRKASPIRWCRCGRLGDLSRQRHGRHLLHLLPVAELLDAFGVQGSVSQRPSRCCVRSVPRGSHPGRWTSARSTCSPRRGAGRSSSGAIRVERFRRRLSSWGSRQARPTGSVASSRVQRSLTTRATWRAR